MSQEENTLELETILANVEQEYVHYLERSKNSKLDHIKEILQDLYGHSITNTPSIDIEDGVIELTWMNNEFHLFIYIYDDNAQGYFRDLGIPDSDGLALMSIEDIRECIKQLKP